MKQRTIAILFIFIAASLLIIYGKDFMFITKHDRLDETFTNASFSKVAIDAVNASIDVQSTKISSAKVEVSGLKNKRPNVQLDADVNGDTLSVKIKDTRKVLRFPFGKRYEAVVVKVFLPEKQYDEMIVKINNGKIAVNDLKAESINARTDNGQIRLSETVAKSVEAKSANGKIVFNYVTGNIKANTATGKIAIITENLNSAIDVQTDVGKIDIQVDQMPDNATVNILTSVEKVNLFGSEDRKAVYGSGEHLIQLKTEVGKVNVDLTGNTYE